MAATSSKERQSTANSSKEQQLEDKTKEQAATSSK
jgi:hypothetical protein